MIFAGSAFIFMYVGRKFGWAVSRNALYLSPVAIVLVLCVLWGASVAYGIHTMIVWRHPNLALKIIFGFLLGGYVAVPNYGLIVESSIPPEAMPRHNLISMLPLWTYILASIAFAWVL